MSLDSHRRGEQPDTDRERDKHEDEHDVPQRPVPVPIISHEDERV